MKNLAHERSWYKKLKKIWFLYEIECTTLDIPLMRVVITFLWTTSVRGGTEKNSKSYIKKHHILKSKRFSINLSFVVEWLKKDPYCVVLHYNKTWIWAYVAVASKGFLREAATSAFNQGSWGGSPFDFADKPETSKNLIRYTVFFFK